MGSDKLEWGWRPFWESQKGGDVSADAVELEQATKRISTLWTLLPGFSATGNPAHPPQHTQQQADMRDRKALDNG